MLARASVHRRCWLSAAAALGAAALATPSSAAAAPSAPSGFTVSSFATAPPNTRGPDDLTALGGHVFATWQNGVPTTGGTPPGATNSTIVEYSTSGATLNTWSVAGKADGIGADPENERVIVTVNEDGNSSLFTITPGASAPNQVVHYTYNPAPDAGSGGGIATGGGTDAVQVLDGRIFLSASNPTPANATAVFAASLDPATKVAKLSPTFLDDSSATSALTGDQVTLALTDPDSNARVPGTAPRFPGQFVLDAQGDQQLVFVKDIGEADGFGPWNLTQLPLSHATSGGTTSAGVDDVRWSDRAGGTLYIVDRGATPERIWSVRGPFAAGAGYASLDTVGASGDNTEVDSLNTATGLLSPFVTGLTTAKGLVYVNPPRGENEQGDAEHGGNAQAGDEKAHGARHHRRHARRRLVTT